MHIAVINKRRHPVERPPAISIGPPSPLGNPFKMSKAMGREQMLARYAAWLDRQLAQPDSAAACEMARLRAILEEEGQLTLVCWCAPLPCHGDAIRERLLRLVQQPVPLPDTPLRRVGPRAAAARVGAAGRAGGAR